MNQHDRVVPSVSAVLLSCFDRYTGRPDAIIVPCHVNFDFTTPRIENLTIVWIEIQSGGKEMVYAELQLAAVLAAISRIYGRAYGIVIDVDFTEARLVKFSLGTQYSDGTFHPSVLPKVCCDIMDGIIV